MSRILIKPSSFSLLDWLFISIFSFCAAAIFAVTYYSAEKLIECGVFGNIKEMRQRHEEYPTKELSRDERYKENCREVDGTPFVYRGGRYICVNKSILRDVEF